MPSGGVHRADPGEKRDTAKGINHQRVDSQKELDLNMPNREDDPIDWALRERAVALARERGEVRTAELTAIGIPRCDLLRMCDEGLLVKVAYGRYRAVILKAA
jgi:hypothetical protein